jgi:hypothetical protein
MKYIRVRLLLLKRAVIFLSSGEPARVGLSSSAAILAAILKKLETEEELEEVLGHSSEDEPVPGSSATEVGAQE